ncbi:MAG: hypothetical protein MUC56_09485 [Thermoanaerobaculales bacterium]|jgi:hypothetical protein|nr:hypothetical protein [Thermoanaerobaculales bacterium]
MNSGVEGARERRGFIERIGARIPGFRGYLEAELRRDVDKMQRDWLAARVDRGRDALAGSIRLWSGSGNLANLGLASSVDKGLDRLANRIRHADYGSSGFFDPVKIRADELDRLYAFDLALIGTVDALVDRIEGLPATAAEPDLRTLLDAVHAADRQFDERANVFEDVTQKGGL